MNKILIFFACLFLLIVIGVLVLAFLIPPGNNLKDVPQFLKDNRTDYINLGDVRLHYLKMGTGSPIILLHGGGTWLYSYRNNINELARSHTVYALDMPGHGFTTYNNNFQLSLVSFSNLISSFMTKQDIDNADFVGSSWGGGWALHFAEAYPQKVGKIVLLDAVGTTEIANNDGSAWKYLAYPLLGELMVHFFSFESVKNDIRTNVFSDPDRISDEEIKQVYIPLTFTNNLKAQIALQRNLKWIEVDTRLDQIKNKTLIIWGKNDKYIPIKFGAKLKTRLSDSTFVTIENAGHLPHEEQPEQVNKLMVEFLK